MNMGAHLKPDPKTGILTFQSDKFPTTPLGLVPFSVKDPDAQDLLWEYAQRHKERDLEFSLDLERALRNAGYKGDGISCAECETGVALRRTAPGSDLFCNDCRVKFDPTHGEP